MVMAVARGNNTQPPKRVRTPLRNRFFQAPRNADNAPLPPRQLQNETQKKIPPCTPHRRLTCMMSSTLGMLDLPLSEKITPGISVTLRFKGTCGERQRKPTPTPRQTQRAKRARRDGSDATSGSLHARSGRAGFSRDICERMRVSDIPSAKEYEYAPLSSGLKPNLRPTPPTEISKKEINQDR